MPAGHGLAMGNPEYVQLVYGLYALIALAGLGVFISLLVSIAKGSARMLFCARLPVEDSRLDARSLCMLDLKWLSMRPLSWRFAGRVCLILLTLQFLVIVISRAATASGIVSLDEIEPYWIIVQGVFFHLAAIFSVLVFLRSAGLALSDFFGVKRGGVAREMGSGVVLYLATLPVFLFTTLAYQAFLTAMGYKILMQDVVSVFLAPQPPVFLALRLFFAAVVAPVAEEILFRGVLLPLLGRSIGACRAVLLSSLLFALLHFHIPSLVPLFVLALAFSFAYIHSRNIIVPIVMHILFNSVNLAFLMMLSGEGIWP